MERTQNRHGADASEEGLLRRQMLPSNSKVTYMAVLSMNDVKGGGIIWSPVEGKKEIKNSMKQKRIIELEGMPIPCQQCPSIKKFAE